MSDTTIVIDGLNFISDGDATDLLNGGVHAANVTVLFPFADLRTCIDDLAGWHARLRRPDSQWLLVERASDIDRAKDLGKVGLIMGWQNILPIEDRLDRILLFHRLGVRVMQLSYNEASPFGDGCTEQRQGGLTELGRRAVAEMNEVGVAIDLSHCAEPTTVDTARASTKPVLLTHIAASAVFRQFRNRSNQTIREVAETGGVSGVSIHGFMNWDGHPEHPPSLEGFVENVRHIANVAGIEHVGIGTDHACVGDKRVADAFINMSNSRYGGTGAAGPFVRAFGGSITARYPKEVPDPSQFPRLLEALQRGGFSADQVDKIAGGNFRRVFGEVWGG